MREVWVRGMAVSYVLGKNTKLTVHVSTQERNMGTCTQCKKPYEFLGGGGTCVDYSFVSMFEDSILDSHTFTLIFYQ